MRHLLLAHLKALELAVGVVQSESLGDIVLRNELPNLIEVFV